MMRVVFFLISLAFVGELQAASAPERPDAQKIWKRFRICAQQPEEAQLVSCASEFLQSSLPKPQKQKMIQFLDMGLKFSALHECFEGESVEPVRLAPGESAYCMHLGELNKKTFGYVVFVKENGQIRIKEIKFKI